MNGNFSPRHWLRRLLVGCALAYPIILLATALAFYYVGEGWWVTAAGLYVPRFPCLFPVPFALAILWATGRKKLLWTQLLAVFIAVVPLMGFVFPFPARAAQGAPLLRVLSFNVDSVRAGPEVVADAVFAASPDLALLQEITSAGRVASLLRDRFPYVESSTQFIIASRYRIVSRTEPGHVLFQGRERPSQFVRYVIETPLGELAIYNVHPLSPRGVLHLRTFHAVVPELRAGQLLAGNPEGDVRSNSQLRALQIGSAADSAGRESLPVLIAGDTNLPGLSAILRKNLGSFRDGFRAASWGFGYTFPVQHPFLRLDRILASDRLRFVSFQIACRGASDHLCLVADIEARP